MYMHLLWVLVVQELLLWWSTSTVPSTRTISSLDAGVVFRLASMNELLRHPVRPQALLRAADLTGEGCTTGDLVTAKINSQVNHNERQLCAI